MLKMRAASCVKTGLPTGVNTVKFALRLTLDQRLGIHQSATLISPVRALSPGYKIKTVHSSAYICEATYNDLVLLAYMG